MKISVNNKEMEIAPETSINQLAASLELPDKGVAIAMNNKMIPRTNWESHQVLENDNIIIIKAACGG